MPDGLVTTQNLSIAIVAIVWLISVINSREIIVAWRKYQRWYIDRCREYFDALYRKQDPRKYFINNHVMLVLMFFVFTYFVGAFWAVVFCFFLAYFPWFSMSRQHSKRRERLDDMLPEGLISMSNSLKAGLTLPQGMRVLVDNMSPPISQEFDLLLKEHRLGVTLDDAMTNMGRRAGSQNLDLVITSIQVARLAGGNLGQVFEDTATAIREIRRLEDKISTMTSQGKMQAFVLGGLPFGLGLALYGLDPTMITPLFIEPVGWIILFFIGLLEIIGIFFIRKIINVDV